MGNGHAQMCTQSKITLSVNTVLITIHERKWAIAAINIWKKMVGDWMIIGCSTLTFLNIKLRQKSRDTFAPVSQAKSTTYCSFTTTIRSKNYNLLMFHRCVSSLCVLRIIHLGESTAILHINSVYRKYGQQILYDVMLIIINIKFNWKQSN